MRPLFFAPLLLAMLASCFFLTVCAQEVVYPRKEFLPADNLFAPIILDPMESQLFGSFVLETQVNHPKNRYLLPFGVGLNKGFFRKDVDAEHSWELRLEATAITVFEWAFFEEDSWQRNLVSTDYKAGSIFNYVFKENELRVRFWHVSSHLGDDYLIRNQITSYSPNPINYEQLDFTYARNIRTWRCYAGAGTLVRLESLRKRLSFQAGTIWTAAPENPERAHWTAGIDIKSFEQNDFRPNFKVGAGLELGAPNRHPFRVLLEFYDGHLPYSVFETDLIQWVGIGTYTSI